MASNLRLRKHKVTGQKALSAVALNATEALRTLTLDVRDCTSVSVQVNLTRDAATSLVCTPTVSYDGGTTYANKTKTTFTGGAGAVAAEVDTVTTSATGNWEFGPYDVANADDLKLVFSGASGGAGDLIDVYVTMRVGD